MQEDHGVTGSELEDSHGRAEDGPVVGSAARRRWRAHEPILSHPGQRAPDASATTARSCTNGAAIGIELTFS